MIIWKYSRERVGIVYKRHQCEWLLPPQLQSHIKYDPKQLPAVIPKTTNEGYYLFLAIKRLLHGWRYITPHESASLLPLVKYVIVLALLLSGSHAEARYRHGHHHPSSDRAICVYDPPRVETRDTAKPMVSVFDASSYELRYTNLDDLFKELYTPPQVVGVVDTTPQPPVVSTSKEETKAIALPYLLIGAGVTVLLSAFFRLVTGRYDDATVRYWRKSPSSGVVTLVETRRYLPLWVSSVYLFVKHYVRLH